MSVFHFVVSVCFALIVMFSWFSFVLSQMKKEKALRLRIKNSMKNFVNEIEVFNRKIEKKTRTTHRDKVKSMEWKKINDLQMKRTMTTLIPLIGWICSMDWIISSRWYWKSMHSSDPFTVLSIRHGPMVIVSMMEENIYFHWFSYVYTNNSHGNFLEDVHYRNDNRDFSPIFHNKNIDEKNVSTCETFFHWNLSKNPS